MIDVFSFVTNGAIMLTLGAAAIWLAHRGIRDRRVTWPLVAVTARLRDHADHRRAPGGGLPARPRRPALARRSPGVAAPDVGIRVGLAAIPLALWVLSNLWRYHWVRAAGAAARAASAGSRAPTSTRTSTSPEFARAVLLLVPHDASRSSFHWWMFSPYVVRLPPTRALRSPITLIGIAIALFRGTRAAAQRDRASSSSPSSVAHFTVFCMLYLAIILTGGGDFVYRYFSAAEAAAACLAGASFAVLFRNPQLSSASRPDRGRRSRSRTGHTAPRRS